MPEAHKRAYRHPKYKTAYRVKNWPAYNQALRERGDITLWLSHEVIDGWTPPQTGKRGAQPVYADIAIETALTFRLLFHLPLRQTVGFVRSILALMDVDLPCPDHTALSRRNATIEISRQVDRAPQGPISLIVDSSGLKVCGQGEWHTQKHGEKQRKLWKKLHIGVDEQGHILPSTVTESHEKDPSHVPALLAQVAQPIARFVGDGIYDQTPVYVAVERHPPGAKLIVPPRKDAVLSPQAAIAPTQRDQHLLAIESDGRLHWKRTSGYYAQSHAENVFARYQRSFGGRLWAKRDASQEREAALACELLNRMRELGRPSSIQSAKRDVREVTPLAV